MALNKHPHKQVCRALVRIYLKEYNTTQRTNTHIEIYTEKTSCNCTQNWMEKQRMNNNNNETIIINWNKGKFI